MMTSNKGATVPMIRGVTEIKAPPPPSVLGEGDVMGKGVTLLIGVETGDVLANGVGKQEYIAVMAKSDSNRVR